MPNSQTPTKFNELNMSKFLCAKLFDDLQTYIALLDVEGRIIYVNLSASKEGNTSLREMKGRYFWEGVWFDDDVAAIAMVKNDIKACAAGKKIFHELTVDLTNDRTKWFDFNLHPILDDQGNVLCLVAEGRDITRAKLQQNALEISQRLEVLGLLSAEVSHDYNNFLGIIGGYAELLLDNLSDDSKLKEYVVRIQDTVDRGNALTGKILSISKDTNDTLVAVNINEILDKQRDILSKLLAPNIILTYEQGNGLWDVQMNIADFERAIVNTALNSIDAIEKGGSFTIHTNNVFLDGSRVHNLAMDVGGYVEVSIVDNGCGMDEKTARNVFNPFFSTKGDNGTGIGMSQVFGFVQRSNGGVEIISKLGHGTTINFFFPRIEKQTV